jgi:hypothetical protein
MHDSSSAPVTPVNISRQIFRLLFLAWLSIASWSEVLGAIYVMPREFVQYAEAHGCMQIEEFFDKTGAMNPPYVYGFLKGDAEGSGAFWCKKKIADDKPYVLLIFLRRPNVSSLTCPRQIEWWNSPGGLTVHREKVLTLDSFKKISDAHQPGSKHQRLEQNVIMSSYDGVSVMFYCHNGEWYYRMTH